MARPQLWDQIHGILRRALHVLKGKAFQADLQTDGWIHPLIEMLCASKIIWLQTTCNSVADDDRDHSVADSPSVRFWIGMFFESHCMHRRQLFRTVFIMRVHVLMLMQNMHMYPDNTHCPEQCTGILTVAKINPVFFAIDFNPSHPKTYSFTNAYSQTTWNGLYLCFCWTL